MNEEILLNKITEILQKNKLYDYAKSITKIRFIIETHGGLGNKLRNDWGLLTKNTEEYNFFKNIGLIDPNDMSIYILNCWYSNENKKEKFDRKKFINDIQKYRKRFKK